jgi:hypothetical protein
MLTTLKENRGFERGAGVVYLELISNSLPVKMSAPTAKF